MCHFYLELAQVEQWKNITGQEKMENHYVKQAGYTKRLPKVLSFSKLLQNLLKDKPKSHNVVFLK